MTVNFGVARSVVQGQRGCKVAGYSCERDTLLLDALMLINGLRVNRKWSEELVYDGNQRLEKLLSSNVEGRGLFLQSLVVSGKNPYKLQGIDDYILRSFSVLYGAEKERESEYEVLWHKLENHKELSYYECRLVDSLQSCSWLLHGFSAKGILPERFSVVRSIVNHAKEHAFKGFEDGDILFMNIDACNAYYGAKSGLVDKVVKLALKSPYTHVGMFFRGPGGPMICEIQGGYQTDKLYYGMMSMYRGVRVDVEKLLINPLSTEQQRAVQIRIGANMKNQLVTGKHDVSITIKRQIASVLSHLQKGGNKENIDVRQGTQICSEFVAKGLVLAIQEFNSSGYAVTLHTPFPETEKLKRMHPTRLYQQFPGWQDVHRDDAVFPMIPRLSQEGNK